MLSRCKFTRFATSGLAFCAAAACVGASADDGDMPNFSFSGFGTAGVVHSSEDQADFTAGGAKPNGAGHHRSWSADVDSLLGAQLTARITPQISSVLQVIVEQNYDNTYKPKVEWANVRYEVTPEFSVRVGRIALPTFFVSDYRKVGYANPWVRPPVEMYSLVPFTSSDGMDVTYRTYFGEIANTVHALYGRNSSKIPGNMHTEARNILGVANTMELGFTTLRIAYLEADVTIPELNQQFFDLFRQFGPTGIALANRHGVKDKQLRFLGVGGSYDPGTWFLTGEWGNRKSSSFIGQQVAWYASAGYRIGKFTPYMIYSRLKRLGTTSDPGLDLAALPPDPVVQGSAAALNAELNRGFLRTNNQHTISIGTRWDFMKDVALKFQYDRIDLANGSAGTFRNEQAGFQLGGKVDVLSVAVNFVF